MSRTVTVAATQFPCSANVADNRSRAEMAVREAASRGAQIILLQELFSDVYFCQEQDAKWFATALPAPTPSSSSSCVCPSCSCSANESSSASSAGGCKCEGGGDGEFFGWLRALAKELGVVLPVSFFERAGNNYFNSVVVIDADGSIMEGLYRKSHIPDSVGYEEKYYFTPGDTGFRVWKTQYATIGVGICWDQWFPEAARVMALKGAEILFYPTAIGSEPADPSMDSSSHWQRAMMGHSASNLVPIVASNRIGFERLSEVPTVTSPCAGMTFYGRSFITDNRGKILQEADRETATVLVESFDLDQLQRERVFWGVFRDRRPSLYGPILSFDGSSTHSHFK